MCLLLFNKEVTEQSI